MLLYCKEGKKMAYPIGKVHFVKQNLDLGISRAYLILKI